MKEYEYKLDYWLEKIEAKDLIYFIYSKFLLPQIPLDIQEDEGLFAQVIGYGRDVAQSILQSQRPETQCGRVIREAKARVWKWNKEVLDRIYDYQQDEYETLLSECTLCVAWGIIYIEFRDAPRVAFLNQMINVWKTQWSYYQKPFTTQLVKGKTRLDIMFELVRQYETDKCEEEDRKKNEEAQKKANEGRAKLGQISTPSRNSNEMNKPEKQNEEIEALRKENANLKAEVVELKHIIDELQRKQKEGNLCATQPSSLIIADKKKTAVLIVLHAMYRAGWIKGSTRDVTVSEAARLLFNEDVKSLRQLLSTAKSHGSFLSYIEDAEEAMEDEWEELKESVQNEK